MGKLLGLLVAGAGGLIAFHSLSTFDIPITINDILPTPSETAAAVPIPQPATLERRRGEQKTIEARTSEVLPRLVVEAQAEKRVPAQADLARAIQTQLARVGCYTGPVNGVWSDAAQRAMRDFNSHVNASLPVDRPDEVLLALVENYKDTACDCAASEVLVGGRCAPLRSQVTTQARKPAHDLQQARKSAPAKPVQQVTAQPKTVAPQAWRATTKAPDQRAIRPQETIRNAKPIAVPPPTVLATAREQLEQAKEQERRNVDTSTRMGLGLKPTPATTPQPVVPQATAPRPLYAPAQPISPSESNSRLAVVVPPPSIAPAAVEERKSSKYVRKLSPSPPAVVVYRTTSSSYKHYLRSGAIWRRNELNGR